METIKYHSGIKKGKIIAHPFGTACCQGFRRYATGFAALLPACACALRLLNSR